MYFLVLSSNMLVLLADALTWQDAITQILAKYTYYVHFNTTTYTFLQFSEQASLKH